MSASTTPLTPSTSTDATPTDAGNHGGDTGGHNTNTGAGSSLYLFTFLATLFLLLFVSCAIVLRSFFLRRRFRRRIEEAIAAGVLLPPSSGTSRRRDFGEKPKVWDRWATPGGDTWDTLMPVSVRKLYSSKSSSERKTSANPKAPSLRSPRLQSLFRRRQSASPADTSATPSPPTLSRSNSANDIAMTDASMSEKKKLQISVLVAMPSPHPTLKGKERSLGDEWDREEEFPDVVLGVTEVPFRRDPPPAS